MIDFSILLPVPYERSFALKLYEEMLRIRRFEEKAKELYGETKIRGFLHLYIGEEAIGVGVMQALREEDAIVATYREHGHALARGVSMRRIMAEMYGKKEGCSRGRGGSMHLFDAAKRFFGGYAIVGGGLPVAVGLALADRLQNRKRATACFFGDGAMAEGEFHESMNLAALWKLPVLFLCENNWYAMGTALERSQSQTDLCAKAESYKMPTRRVNGMDVVAVHAAAKEAVEIVRGGHGPLFIEFQTYRFCAHSMYDPQLYRDKAEIESWKKWDPLSIYFQRLEERYFLGETGRKEIEEKIAADIEDSIAFAEAAEWEPVEDLLKDIYDEGEGK